MFFDKKIKYLDYLENKERIRGVGFVKIEAWDSVCTLHIQVNGMHGTDNFARKVLFVGEDAEAELCEITLEKGRGSIDMPKLDSQNLAGSGIPYTQLYGIRIPIAAGKEIYCALKEREQAVEEQPAEEQSVEERPITDKEQSAEKQLVEKQLMEEQLTQEQSVEKQLTQEQFAEEKPVEKQLTQEQPTEEQPVEKQLTQEQFAEEKPVEKQFTEEQSAQISYNEDKKPSKIEERQPVEQITVPESEQEVENSHKQEKSVSKQVTAQDIDTLLEPVQDTIAKNIEEFVNKVLQMKVQESVVQKEEAETQEIKNEVEGQEWENEGLEAETPPISNRLQESKWKQLTSIYPHIRPFRDERDYLSIGPGDFVILTEKYYSMANNSFLLHGYYNYKHLILSRLEKRGNIAYYVGVPGNFYEKEKQVALLFGFESFECAKEPALAGDYGYYMMKVEL